MLLRRGRGDEFLEARIFTERVPEWIEAKVGNGDASWNFQQMRNGGNRRVALTEKCLNLRQRHLGLRFVNSVSIVVLDGSLRLLKSLLLFPEPSISEGEIARHSVPLGCDNGVGRWLNCFDRAGETLMCFILPPYPRLAKAKVDECTFSKRVERLSNWERP